MKRIVICADGTWNERDQINKETGRRRPTNVTKVARAVRPRARNGVDQVVFYHDGIGTRGPLDRVTGGAFGSGMENNIRVLYRFIVYNFEPGDELYLFGFSRGAFTVRSLAGFMHKVGLIEKDDDYYVPEIYGCYERNLGPGTPEWTKAFHNVKGTRPCPPIKFIGVWDTVGALGAPGLLGQFLNKDRFKYHDVGLNPTIEHAFHALAIDERRKPFAPDIWTRPAGWRGELEQAWFPGVHSNVGGGYAPDGLANEALQWMVEKAEAQGLDLDTAYLAHYLPCFNSVLHDSMTALYKAMGPIVRAIGAHAADGESVHQCTLDRINLPECRYAPVNVGAGTGVRTVTTTRICTGNALRSLDNFFLASARGSAIGSIGSTPYLTSGGPEIMTRATLTFGSAMLAGAVLILGCSSQPPAADTKAPAEAATSDADKPRREQALLDDLAVANRIMARQLAILDVQGHVTARSLDNPNHYYIARFIGPGDVVTSDFVENDLDSMPVDGPRNDQAREIYLHGEMFKARPDIMAIVHAHTPEFVSYGLSSVPLWNGTEALPVFDLRPFNRGRSGIISTPALGKAMAEKLGKAEAVLLWGHGIAIGAKSIPEVITRVDELRDTAQVQQAVVANGGKWTPQPRPVDEAAVERTWAFNKAAVVEQMGGKILLSAPAKPANPTDPVERAKLDLVLANRILSADDVGVLDEVGHVSVRNPSNPNSYFVASKAAGFVTAADVVERDITKGEAGALGLSIDDEIYKAHPEVKAIVYGRTPEITAFSGSVPLRASVNGGNFIGEGLPVVKMTSLSDAGLGASVAKALDRKNGVLLSGHGYVITGATIYNVTGRAYQVRMNAKIQQQAIDLGGKVTYLVDLPDPGGAAAEGGEGGRGQGAPNAGAGPQGAAQGGGGQQLGPPEGRDWIYWSGNVKLN